MKHRLFTRGDISLLEQGFQSVIEHVVPGLWKFHQALLAEGFTSFEALDLTKSYMLLLVVEPQEPPTPPTADS